MMSSQGVVFATAAAAAAVSGTVFLLALRIQKSIQFPLPHDHHHSSPPIILRSCLSSTSDEKNKKKKKKKRVHFAEDVVVSSRARRDGREERRRNYRDSSSETKVGRSCSNGGIEENRGMPANRVALYNGILRDRVAQRLAYSY